MSIKYKLKIQPKKCFERNEVTYEQFFKIKINFNVFYYAHRLQILLVCLGLKYVNKIKNKK